MQKLEKNDIKSDEQQSCRLYSSYSGINGILHCKHSLVAAEGFTPNYHTLSPHTLTLSALTMFLPSVLWCCWLGGRKGIRPVKILEWWGAGVVICLQRDVDLHMAQLMPLPLTVSCSVKSRLVLPFWYQLTRVVPEKGPINGCVCALTMLVSSQVTGMDRGR